MRVRRSVVFGISDVKRQVRELRDELDGFQLDYAAEINLIRRQLEELLKRVERLEQLYGQAIVAATKLAINRKEVDRSEV